MRRRGNQDVTKCIIRRKPGRLDDQGIRSVGVKIWEIYTDSENRHGNIRKEKMGCDNRDFEKIKGQIAAKGRYLQPPVS